PRPGGDLALALAVARILFDNGWVDPGAAAYCDNLDGFRALAFARTVAEHCDEADVAPEGAADIARRLPDGPTAVLVAWGMGRRRALLVGGGRGRGVKGAAIVRALDALGALSGTLGVPGGGVSFYFKRRGAFDTEFIAGAAVAPRTVCEPLFGRDVLDAKDPP